jgi:hypothetical protein
VKRDAEGDCGELVGKSREYALEAGMEPLPLDENATDEVFNNALLLLGSSELIDGAELGLAPTNAEDAVFVVFFDEVAVLALCEGSSLKLEWTL